MRPASASGTLRSSSWSSILRPIPSAAAVAATIASALLLCAGSAQAEITTFTNQASYLAAVGNTGVDNYNDLIQQMYFDQIPRQAGDYAYSVSAGPKAPAIWAGTSDYVDFWLTSQNRTDTTTFALQDGVAGAGGNFFGSDTYSHPTAAASLLLTATDSTGATVSFTLENPDVHSFVGFVSSANLVSLTVTAGQQPGVWSSIDNFHVSVAAVPEPGTYAMLLAGLGMLGWTARRRGKGA
ncbi:PEP-CTERM sorting domain-containing protein [Massilia dura]|uniref:PEP-CTERM sorting domain-containing protein n=1 Tax=Pseudoduganella dura TaxID=321982 RepID=A0A6I3X6A2_9BURK|nr:PEP-CTERM sorting domain-containing protein [Pseudoduganella dura]